MRRSWPAMIFLGLFPVNAAHADFVGALEFTPAGCETVRQCKLAFDFGYVDPKGIGWQANAGDATDGATIPGWAQPLVGAASTRAL